MKINIEQLEAIGYIFEKGNGNSMSATEEQIIASSELGAERPYTIASQIVKVLEHPNDLSPEYRCGAYWALSKSFDNKLIPYFKKWLHHELQDVDSSSIFQLMIALDNLGEPIFDKDRDGGFSSLEVELNLRDAKSYLKEYV